MEDLKRYKQRKTGHYYGKVFLSNSCGYYEITLANSLDRMRARFIQTGTEVWVNTLQVDTGSVVDKFYPSVCGVGYLGESDKTVNNDKTRIKSYNVWSGMIDRCYGRSKLKPYEDCIVSEEFCNFSYFNEWFYKQIGSCRKDFELDKDILSDGCKIYAEDTCVLVPSEINIFFAKTGAKRGKYPIGVSWCEKAKLFVSSYRNGGDCKTSYHKDEWSAFIAYKKAKENRAKELANKWYGQIDGRVYEKLINYKVLITY